MNRGLWIARKNYLCVLIRKLADSCGEDDADFLKEHITNVIDLYSDEKIEEAINHYQVFLDNLKC